MTVFLRSLFLMLMAVAMAVPALGQEFIDPAGRFDSGPDPNQLAWKKATQVTFKVRNTSFVTYFRVGVVSTAQGTSVTVQDSDPKLIGFNQTANFRVNINPGDRLGDVRFTLRLYGDDAGGLEKTVTTQEFLIVSLAPPEPFTIYQPASYSTVIGNFNLIWEVALNATQYDLRLFKLLPSGLPSTTPALERLNLTTNVNAITTDLLERGASYRAEVTARNAVASLKNTNSDYTLIVQGFASPGAFALTAPGVDSSVEDRPTFTWTASENALNYTLNVFGEVNGAPESMPIRTVTGITTTNHTLDLPGLPRNNFYYVSVTANGEGGTARIMDQVRTRFFVSPAPLQLSPTWYFAEGAVGPGFDTFYLIANPHDYSIRVLVDFLLESGENKSTDVFIPKKSRYTIKLADIIPGSTGVSGVLRELTGEPFAAERAMYSMNDNGRWGGAHAVVGTMEATPEWFLAEGATVTAGPANRNFETYILIANPTEANVPVRVTFYPEGSPAFDYTLTVDAQRRRTIAAADTDPRLVNKAFSTRVTSTDGSPIIVERAMWWRAANWPYGSFMEGNASPGLTELSTRWFFAEGNTIGNDEFLLFVNTTESTANITIHYLLETAEKQTRTFSLEPNQRRTVNVRWDTPGLRADARHGTAIDSSVPIAVERSMYFTSGAYGWVGGHNSIGSRWTAREWVLPEGADVAIGGGRLGTEILVANPSTEDATVTFEFLRGDGQVVTHSLLLRGHRRATVVAERVLGLYDQAYSTIVRSTVPVVVERSMYFNTDEPTTLVRTGGTCSLGIPIGIASNTIGEFIKSSAGEVAKEGIEGWVVPTPTPTPIPSPTPFVSSGR